MISDLFDNRGKNPRVFAFLENFDFQACSVGSGKQFPVGIQWAAQ